MPAEMAQVMRDIKRVEDLDIDIDDAQQANEWILERIGWGVALLVLIGASAGLLGKGPLSRATSGDKESGLWIEYSRITRHEAPDLLEVNVRPAAAGEVALTLSSEFLKNIRVDQIAPEPAYVQAEGALQRFVFVAADSQPFTISFSYKPSGYRPLEGSVQLKNGPSLSFKQFILP